MIASSRSASGSRRRFGKPVEDRVETDPQLEPGEVHAEALVRAGAEREVVLRGATEPPLLRRRPSAPRRGSPSR